MKFLISTYFKAVCKSWRCWIACCAACDFAQKNCYAIKVWDVIKCCLPVEMLLPIFSLVWVAEVHFPMPDVRLNFLARFWREEPVYLVMQHLQWPMPEELNLRDCFERCTRLVLLPIPGLPQPNLLDQQNLVQYFLNLIPQKIHFFHRHCCHHVELGCVQHHKHRHRLDRELLDYQSRSQNCMRNRMIPSSYDLLERLYTGSLKQRLRTRLEIKLVQFLMT